MKFIDELKTFALRGNVVDLVVGFTVGAAFTTIAKSLVDDIIMPPVGVLMGNIDFADLYVVIKGGDAVTAGMSVAQAKEAGAVTINYGTFINNVIAFAVVTVVMFYLIRMLQRIESPFAKKAPGDEPPKSKPCPYCQMEISIAATRCPHCTSQLDAAPQQA